MFDYLLSEHLVIISNPLQTNAHDFWLVRMVAAVQCKHQVGIANLSQYSINWFDPMSYDCGEWLEAQGARSPGAAERDHPLRHKRG